MQIVSSARDNLHEMSGPYFLGKIRKNVINLSSAEFAQGVVKVKIGKMHASLETGNMHIKAYQSHFY